VTESKTLNVGGLHVSIIILQDVMTKDRPMHMHVQVKQTTDNFAEYLASGEGPRTFQCFLHGAQNLKLRCCREEFLPVLMFTCY